MSLVYYITYFPLSQATAAIFAMKNIPRTVYRQQQCSLHF